MANRRRAVARRPNGEGASGRALVSERAAVVLMCGVLALAVWLVFGQTLHHGFVNFDDNKYVYDNHAVVPGLTLHGIAWAFTHVHADNWHPLTWLSHMLDCQLFGLQPAGITSTSVVLHAVNAILLFLAAPAHDGCVLAERLRRRALRRPPAARRVGGLGRRAQGRSQRRSSCSRWRRTRRTSRARLRAGATSRSLLGAGARA